jgi:hypothetical protein
LNSIRLRLAGNAATAFRLVGADAPKPLASYAKFTTLPASRCRGSHCLCPLQGNGSP